MFEQTETFPLWVAIMLSGVGLFGLGAGIYILSQIRGPAAMPRTRLYSRSPSSVAAAVLSVGTQLGFTVAHIDENSISLVPIAAGEEFLVVQTLHVVMLATGDGQTALEVIGGRSDWAYHWHSTAQIFLKELDLAIAAAA